MEDLLLVQTKEGEIVLLEPSPDGPREPTRFAVLEGKTWNPPALAGTLLAVRNDREAAVYDCPPSTDSAASRGLDARGVQSFSLIKDQLGSRRPEPADPSLEVGREA